MQLWNAKIGQSSIKSNKSVPARTLKRCEERLNAALPAWVIILVWGVVVAATLLAHEMLRESDN